MRKEWWTGWLVRAAMAVAVAGGAVAVAGKTVDQALGVGNGVVRGVEQRARYDDGAIVGRMKNGMGYVIVPTKVAEDKVSMRIDVNVGAVDVNVGAVDEDAAYEGIAHLTEHVVGGFGSDTAREKAFRRFLGRNGLTMGASQNEGTTFEQTFFYVSDLPAYDSVIDSTLIYMRDMIFDLNADDRAIDDNRRVVLAEMLSTDQSAESWMKETTDSISGYARHSILGTPTTLGRIDCDVLMTFYQENYIPANTHIYIVGDVDAEAVERLLLNRLSDLDNHGQTPRVREVKTVKTKPTLLIRPRRGDEASAVSLCFVCPMLDDTAQNVLSYLFGVENVGSTVNVASEKKSVRSAFYEASSMCRQNRLMFTMPSPNNLMRETADALLAMAKRLKYEGLSDEEYENFRHYVLMVYGRFDDLTKLLTHHDIISALSAADGEYATNERLRQDIHKLLSLSREQINDVVRRLIDSRNLTLVAACDSDSTAPQWPDIEELISEAPIENVEDRQASIRRVVESISRDFGEQQPVGEVVETIGDVECLHLVYENGAEVYCPKIGGTADGVTRMTMLTPVGAYDIIDGLGGSAFDAKFIDASFCVLDRGELSGCDIADFMSPRTVRSARLSVEDKYSALRLDAFDENAEMMMKFAHFMLSNDLNDASARVTFERTKDYIAQNFVADRSEELRRFRNLMYDSADVSRYKELNLERLDELTYDKFSREVNAIFHSLKSPTFIIEGDVENVKTLCNKYIGTLTALPGSGVSDYADRAVGLSHRVEERTYSAHGADNSCRVLMAFGMDGVVDAKQRAVLKMIDAVLYDRFNNGGREEASTYYEIASRVEVDDVNRTVRMTLSVSVAPENVESVISQIKKTLDDMADKPMSRDEFIKVRSEVISSFDTRASGAVGVEAKTIAKMCGVDFLSDEELSAAARTVTTRDILNEMKRLLTAPTRVIQRTNYIRDEKN